MKPAAGYLLLIAAAILLFSAGCSHEISVTRVGSRDRLGYGSVSTGNGLNQNTANLLANLLLSEQYEENPEGLLQHLQKLFRNEPRPEHLAAMADVALNLGLRFASDPDRAVGYHLAAALYSHTYLQLLDRPGEQPYSEERVGVMRIYNAATGEVFLFLRQRNLLHHKGYRLTAAGGQRVTFQAPEFRLPLSPESYSDFLLCADYRPENLTHVSRRFGLGAPLICRVKPHLDEVRFTDNQTLPATLVLQFKPGEENRREVTGQLVFFDSRNCDEVQLGRNRIPLEQDFSTPLAYMAHDPLPFGYLEYMLNPDKTVRMQGLYMFEPYSDDRIPVVLVHGLMSNARTWMQMINTLQNDPDLRKHYQFWGFSYSSGNPVLYSAQLLREDLQAEADRLQATGRPVKMFNRMVLIGHSMGGLLSKTLIMNAENRLVEPLLGDNYREMLASLTAEQRDFVTRMMDFKALPFVQRVVFIAVPHRGSEMANSAIGRIGASLVELPQSLVQRGEGVIGNLMRHGWLQPDNSKFQTGIDNLDPNNRTLQLLETIPFRPGVPYHSVIGNRKEAGIPGGSDGIVPYASSHLDGAVSELVVKSDHSAQQNPLAIREIRRILLEHLRQYPDIQVATPELPEELGEGAAEHAN